jgi:hypothetical protein
MFPSGPCHRGCRRWGSVVRSAAAGRAGDSDCDAGGPFDRMHAVARRDRPRQAVARAGAGPHNGHERAASAPRSDGVTRRVEPPPHLQHQVRPAGPPADLRAGERTSARGRPAAMNDPEAATFLRSTISCSSRPAMLRRGLAEWVPSLRTLSSRSRSCASSMGPPEAAALLDVADRAHLTLSSRRVGTWTRPRRKGPPPPPGDRNATRRAREATEGPVCPTSASRPPQGHRIFSPSP